MKKPNIIVIITDDQGYGDLSCMNIAGTTDVSDFKTPNIDSLAESGALFTDFYSNSPVCSPSRASLLTGKYPGNAGVRSILGADRNTNGISNKTPTIASVLKEFSYKTAAIGKWHLGVSQKSRPNNNGFDYFFGFLAGCIDYYSHLFYYGNSNPLHDLWENNKEIYRNGKYMTEMITEKSVEFINNNANSEKPFFLYTAYNAPHYPMHVPKKYLERFRDLPEDRKIMAAMISAVDDGVGEIIKELKEQKIYEDTIIFFMSDNGPSRESRNWMDGNPDRYYGGTSGGLKGHKYSLFDGGIRVPAIFNYPSVISGNQVISAPCAAMDIFPTLISFINVKTKNYDIDGLDISSVLTEKSDSPHDMIFWEMNEQTAVRKGNYKLVINGYAENEESVPLFLSDLSQDIGEHNNLIDIFPEITNQLKNAAINWRNEIEINYRNKLF